MKRKLEVQPSDNISNDQSTSSPSDSNAVENAQKKSNKYFPAFMGCRSVSEYEQMNRIEEGMYGVVFRGRDKRTNETVALKRLKMEREREGFPITSLREINCLIKCRHENIVCIREVVVGDNMDKIFLVMDYVEHDLKALMEGMKRPFTLDQTKTLLIQLLRGVGYLHENWVIHRDIKTSNLLLNHRGILKIADFGLAREYGSPLRPYTAVVVTLWYRAPELLLGIKEYSYPIDLWSVGCVFAELVAKKPIFPAKSEIEQITKIFQELGTPNDKIWPGPPAFSQLPFSKNIVFKNYFTNNLKSRFNSRLTSAGINLLNKFFTYDPNLRVTTSQALEHDFFRESPLPLPPSLFPTWPTKHELENRRKKENASPKAPPGGDKYCSQTEEEALFENQLYKGVDNIGFTMSASGKGSFQPSRSSIKMQYP